MRLDVTLAFKVRVGTMCVLEQDKRRLVGKISRLMRCRHPAHIAVHMRQLLLLERLACSISTLIQAFCDLSQNEKLKYPI